ncbi:hypothetical protein ACA910_010378 [Epithemia clementina (nom. ined.)]
MVWGCNPNHKAFQACRSNALWPIIPCRNQLWHHPNPFLARRPPRQRQDPVSTIWKGPKHPAGNLVPPEQQPYDQLRHSQLPQSICVRLASLRTKPPRVWKAAPVAKFGSIIGNVRNIKRGGGTSFGGGNKLAAQRNSCAEL